jgi:hypothetical protein
MARARQKVGVQRARDLFIVDQQDLRHGLGPS